MSFQLNEHLELLTLLPEHADKLFKTIDENRPYLRRWLPWLDWNKTVQSSRAFIQTKENKYRYGIFYKKELVGVIGFNLFSQTNRTASIGYWICEEMSGRGFATKCVKKMLEIGFLTYGLKRVAIKASPENFGSLAVIEKCNLTFEGIERNGENLYGIQRDLKVYSITEEQYKQTCMNTI